jgi:uncharacterized membrane protein
MNMLNKPLDILTPIINTPKNIFVPNEDYLDIKQSKELKKKCSKKDNSISNVINNMDNNISDAITNTDNTISKDITNIDNTISKNITNIDNNIDKTLDDIINKDPYSNMFIEKVKKNNNNNNNNIKKNNLNSNYLDIILSLLYITLVVIFLLYSILDKNAIYLINILVLTILYIFYKFIIR